MLLLDALITVLPVVGLYSQYSLIKSRKHIGSFSIDTCAFYLLAAILRIMFWFSKGFALNLFIQSFVVIGMTYAILQLCIDIGYKKNNSLTDLNGKEEQGFWRWNSIGPFIVCTVFFSTFMGLLTGFFVYFDISIYGQIIGLIAMVIQCCIGFPQLLNNHQAKSVQGLSIFMITTWFFGDFFKTLYFIIQLQPLQFIIGGAIQLTVDLLLVIQILAYKQSYFSLQSTKDYPTIKDQISLQTPSKLQYNVRPQEGI